MDADVGCLQQSSDLRKVGLSPSIPWHVGFRYLEELHLKRVIVDGKLIEQLLANSPVLERLTLDDARTLNRLRVAGQSLKLKYLCVACCFDLECIEICDMDLVSFTFVGLYSLLSMDKLPQLHEVSLSGCISIVRNYLPQLSSLPCLQILELEFDYSHPAHLAIPSHLPKLTSVKQLKLRVGGSGDISLLPLTIVIKACPYLRSFVFELTNPWWKPNEKGRELERVVGPVHQYLKEVEFYNYYGRPCDYELVNYLVENAIALEKLMVNPCDLALEPYDKGYFSGRMIKVKEPRERAVQQLKGKLPSKIELVIT
ncbi:hypothetical protein ACJRO7_001898 [Eucalyptus globulus]|uniref:At1g61320/AtMIF1 LRR domain-containing protein n=1 Tax=Eucalyptus globulus TaxID=34317 RepID=A0ABD3M2C6_EUCGL